MQQVNSAPPEHSHFGAAPHDIAYSKAGIFGNESARINRQLSEAGGCTAQSSVAWHVGIRGLARIRSESRDALVDGAMLFLRPDGGLIARHDR
jgi:hypothetical protein